MVRIRTTDDPVLHERATVAALARHRPSDDPELAVAREWLADQRRWRRVEQLVADWPELSDDQINRIAALLNAGGGDG